MAEQINKSKPDNADDVYGLEQTTVSQLSTHLQQPLSLAHHRQHPLLHDKKALPSVSLFANHSRSEIQNAADQLAQNPKTQRVSTHSSQNNSISPDQRNLFSTSALVTSEEAGK